MRLGAVVATDAHLQGSDTGRDVTPPLLRGADFSTVRKG